MMTPIQDYTLIVLDFIGKRAILLTGYILGNSDVGVDQRGAQRQSYFRFHKPDPILIPRVEHSFTPRGVNFRAAIPNDEMTPCRRGPGWTRPVHRTRPEPTVRGVKQP